MRLEPLFNAFIRDLRASGSTEETEEAYRSDYNILLSFLREQKGQGPADNIHALTPARLGPYPAWLNTRPSWVHPGRTLAPRTIARRLNSMSSFCRWLVRRGDLQTNPFDRVSRPKRVRNLPRPISVETAEGLLRVGETPRERLMVALMYYEGLRVGEVRNLRTEDVDLVNGLLRVTGKGNKERVLRILAPLRPYMEAYLFDHKGDLLFPGNNGHAISRCSVGRILDRMATKLGVPRFTPHRLRHTFGTEAVRAGAKLTAVQSWMGHENPETTMVYVKITAQDIEQSASVIEAHYAARVAK